MLLILFYMFLQGTGAVIYRLNVSQYARMPPLVQLDSYEACQLDPDPLYCSAEFQLVSDEPSPLLDMIKKYSEHRVTHYNHARLRYGICVTQSCSKFYESKKSVLNSTLEGCLNESLVEKYGLKVKVLDGYICKQPGIWGKEIDTLDIIVAVISAIILIVNLVGSLCYIVFEKNEGSTALRLLLCFSIQRNWKKLMAPVAKDQDPRLRRLKSIHGLRALSTAVVIIGHSLFSAVILAENTKFVEEFYTTRPLNILLNGSLTMQTFLIISAFLLIYNWLLYSEQHEVSWNMLPKLIIIRWLRLTPVYAIIIALTATWFGHLSSGPLWNKFVAKEISDCRKYWWQNILYINNYFNHSECVAQSWYLATDTQLYYMAAIVYLACGTARSRKIILSLLLVIGMIIPAVHVYIQDLDGILVISPEKPLTFFLEDEHYNTIYKRGYTNIAGYVLGMMMGYLVYYWQNEGMDFHKYKSRLVYRLLYWSLVPLGLLSWSSAVIFYYDGPRVSIYIRTVYAAFLKPVFSLIICAAIVGFIFKFEDVYRGILEWRGWTSVSRLSYSAYLLHVVLVRNHVAAQTKTIQVSIISAAEVCISILFATCVAAFLVWLLVEAPFSNLMKECLLTPTIKSGKEKENNRSKEDIWKKTEDSLEYNNGFSPVVFPRV